MNDRELLALAANAAGYNAFPGHAAQMIEGGWNPLTDDGDALRLAQRLAIEIKPSNRHDYGQAAGNVSVCRDDLTPMEALRRAIVMAAAEIGRQMK